MAGLVGGLGRKPAQEPKLVPIQVHANLFERFAQCGIQRGFAGFKLAAGQLEAGAGLFAHAQHRALGVADHHGGDADFWLSPWLSHSSRLAITCSATSCALTDSFWLVNTTTAVSPCATA